MLMYKKQVQESKTFHVSLLVNKKEILLSVKVCDNLLFQLIKVGRISMGFKIQIKLVAFGKESISYGLKSSFKMMGSETNAILFIYVAFSST